MSKNNVIQLQNVLPILCKFLKFTQFTVIQIKNLYKRKPLDHVFLKLINYIQVMSI